MTLIMRSAILLPALLALAACGSDPQPGGVTAGEAKALDEAAEMLEAQRLPEAAVKPVPQQVPQSEAAPGSKP